MQVALSTWSKFHFFELGRRLISEGMLSQIFTNVPHTFLRKEGLPRAVIESNAFPAILNYGLARTGLPCPTSIRHWLAWQADASQIEFVRKRLRECDVFVGLSGSGLSGGTLTQKRGGAYICERASSHILWQKRALEEEYAAFGASPPFFDSRMVEKELEEYSVSDRIVVPSNFVRNSFIEAGIASRKIRVIPYGVDVSKFKMRPEVAATDEFRVIYVGHISLRKGIPYLIEGFSRMKHPRKKLTLIGAVHSEMQQVLRSLPLENVEFVKPIPKSQLVKYYHRADAFCMASVEEGLAYVIAEAMASGLPVIATETSGASDILVEGVSGFVIAPRDAHVIQDRLEMLASSPEIARRMGNNARNATEALGGWNEHGGAYIEEIRDLAASKSR
jgi:glycosyltransferase involved in cell wall biosynthesis